MGRNVECEEQMKSKKSYWPRHWNPYKFRVTKWMLQCDTVGNVEPPVVDEEQYLHYHSTAAQRAHPRLFVIR